MKLCDKYPQLKNKYSQLNNTIFEEKEYRYDEYLFWDCPQGHHIYKPAREINRYQNCNSCENIKKTGIEFFESLEYLYPSIVEKYSVKNILSANSVRPDSLFNAIWEDRDEKIKIYDRVLEEISSGNVKRNHVTKRNVKNRKKKGNVSAESISKPQEKEDSPLLKDAYPDLYEMRLNDCEDLNIWSNKKLLWKCDKGHEFTSSIRNLIKRSTKCNVCSGVALQKGVNDISTLAPDLASCIVSPDPSEITLAYNKPITFKCFTCMHQWVSNLDKRKDRSLRCPGCSGKTVIPGFNDLETIMPHIKNSWAKNNKYMPSEMTTKSEKEVYLYCSNGISHDLVKTYAYVISRTPNRRTYLCNHCSGSAGEIDMANFIASLGFTTIRKDRKIIRPKELDVYLPDLKVAFEYNGLYWHSDQAGKSDTYHYDKWKRCADKGIQLISIWEDDWNYREDIVKRMIAHKLGVSNDRKVYARQTDVVIVDKDDARAFCNAHHIQGYVSGSVYYGLKDRRTDSLVAVSVWKRSGDQLRLERYCTSENVIGGMGKMLKAGVQYAKDNGLSKIVTFSDHDISDGGLYRRLGFIPDKELKPDYKYIVGGTRVHKFNYRIKRFRDDPNLKYADGLTESELAQLNSLPRVYDAGKTRWAINVS